MSAHSNFPDFVKSTALFGPENDPSSPYRYRLSRRWFRLGTERVAVFVMLNPSTADAFKLDPTVRRCCGFADAFGCCGLDVVNLYALRSTEPAALWKHSDPVGADNDRHILEVATSPGAVVVLAWGSFPRANGRAKRVIEMLRSERVVPWCLGKTKSGAPRHPLYLPGGSEPVPFLEPQVSRK